MKLIKDAKVIREEGCVEAFTLMKEIIIRSPGNLRLQLLRLQINNSISWEWFIRDAEKAAWVGFPEMLVNQIEDRDSNEFVDEKVEMNEINASKGSKAFCHIHGESDHKTTECKIVKLSESKGLIRVKRNQPDEK